MIRAEGRFAMVRHGATAVLVLAAIALQPAAPVAQQSKEPPLNVVEAAVPFYPLDALLASIQGTVRLRVSTDGHRVLDVRVDSGQAMLARAARESVKTWRFQEHKPTTFAATFQYKLLAESACSPDSGIVELRLPTEIQVSAKRPRTCDPAIRGGR